MDNVPTGKQLIRRFDRDPDWSRSEEGAYGVVFSRPGSNGHVDVVNVPRYSQPLPETALRNIAARTGESWETFTCWVED